MTVVSPIGQTTQAILATATSVTTQLTKPATNANYLMQVVNRDPAVTTFIRFGNNVGMGAATILDFPVGPLNDNGFLLDVPLGTTHMAVIGMGGVGGIVATLATVATYFSPVFGQSYL